MPSWKGVLLIFTVLTHISIKMIVSNIMAKLLFVTLTMIEVVSLSSDLERSGLTAIRK